VVWSDGELVLETLAGDREAFGKLVERHRRTILALAIQRGFQQAEAEDVAQEVFVKAFNSLPRLQEPEAFARWLYGITGHVLADVVRTEKRRGKNVGMERVPEMTAAEPRERGERFLNAAEVLRAINELPEAQRMVLTLRYLEGLTPKEIAQRLDQPRGTVRSHLHHALNYLQLAFGAKQKVKS
jgi:RNA polymerase sigma-70 factor (ECF subfamily)